jgi:hypothetical protein
MIGYFYNPLCISPLVMGRRFGIAEWEKIGNQIKRERFETSLFNKQKLN